MGGLYRCHGFGGIRTVRSAFCLLGSCSNFVGCVGALCEPLSCIIVMCMYCHSGLPVLSVPGI